MVRVLQVCQPGGRMPSLPYILAGRAPPGRPRRLQPAPGGAGLSFTAGLADGGGRRRPGRSGRRSGFGSESWGPTREGRGREPRAHSAAGAERGRPPLWFLGWAAPRGAEAMLILSQPPGSVTVWPPRPHPSRPAPCNSHPPRNPDP